MPLYHRSSLDLISPRSVYRHSSFFILSFKKIILHSQTSFDSFFFIPQASFNKKISSSTSTNYNPSSIRRYVKNDLDSCCKLKIDCGCESVDGEALAGGEKGFANQGSFVRQLTLDEQIEALIVYFKGMIDKLMTEFEAKNLAMVKMKT